jgi:hypothetical protein
MLGQECYSGLVPAMVIASFAIAGLNRAFSLEPFKVLGFALLPVLVTETTTLGYGPASGMLTEGLGSFGHKKTARRRLWHVEC